MIVVTHKITHISPDGSCRTIYCCDTSATHLSAAQTGKLKVFGAPIFEGGRLIRLKYSIQMPIENLVRVSAGLQLPVTSEAFDFLAKNAHNRALIRSAFNRDIDDQFETIICRQALEKRHRFYKKPTNNIVLSVFHKNKSSFLLAGSDPYIIFDVISFSSLLKLPTNMKSFFSHINISSDTRIKYEPHEMIKHFIESRFGGLINASTLQPKELAQWKDIVKHIENLTFGQNLESIIYPIIIWDYRIEPNGDVTHFYAIKNPGLKITF